MLPIDKGHVNQMEKTDADRHFANPPRRIVSWSPLLIMKRHRESDMSSAFPLSDLLNIRIHNHIFFSLTTISTAALGSSSSSSDATPQHFPLPLGIEDDALLEVVAPLSSLVRMFFVLVVILYAFKLLLTLHSYLETLVWCSVSSSGEGSWPRRVEEYWV